MNTQKLVSCIRRLVRLGYAEDRALLVVYRTWALTPDELARLQQAMRVAA